jgi:hypothetical protein
MLFSYSANVSNLAEEGFLIECTEYGLIIINLWVYDFSKVFLGGVNNNGFCPNSKEIK